MSGAVRPRFHVDAADPWPRRGRLNAATESGNYKAARPRQPRRQTISPRIRRETGLPRLARGFRKDCATLEVEAALGEHKKLGSRQALQSQQLHFFPQLQALLSFIGQFLPL